MSLSPQDALSLVQRSYAHSAVSTPAPLDQTMLWVGTHLGLAGIDVLVGEGEIDEIIETPVTTSIPGTRPWVMGLAAHKGSLLPIINGDALLRKRPYEGRVREYSMVIRKAGIHFGITLSQVHRNLKLPVDQRVMDICADDAIAKFCLGGFRQNEKLLSVLDVDKLIEESELGDAALIRRELTEESCND
ncbi:MAG: chemotaxis protein CheW [Halioglobus sp.]